MDVGLFCLMGYRTPGTSTAAIYDDAVAQVKAAEQAGFAIAWFAEHHFSNYCVCPSPLMMVARMAGETSRIRLASGVVIVPLYNPARLIAEVGMVDALAEQALRALAPERRAPGLGHDMGGQDRIALAAMMGEKGLADLERAGVLGRHHGLLRRDRGDTGQQRDQCARPASATRAGSGHR